MKNRLGAIVASILLAVVLVTAITGCGSGTRYYGNDIYSDSYGLTYSDACAMGIAPACTGLYGSSYYSSGHPGYHVRHYASLSPRVYRSYSASHPALVKRVAATKQRVVVAKQKAVVQKQQAAAKAKVAAAKAKINAAKAKSAPSYSKPSFSKPSYSKPSFSSSRSSSRR